KGQEDVDLVLLARVARQAGGHRVDARRAGVEGALAVDAAVVDLDLQLAGDGAAVVAHLHLHGQPAADFGCSVEAELDGDGGTGLANGWTGRRNVRAVRRFRRVSLSAGAYGSG